jgi:tetratricopeptide (TPR) repeat protein
VQDEIARAIVRRLRVDLAGENRGRIVKAATTNMDAYQEYLKGRTTLYRRGPWIPRALEQFKRAVALDPEYAQAWAGLSDTYTVMGYSGVGRPETVMPEALAAATRALELDPQSAEAHNALACATLLWERDFATTEREFLRALEINPKYIQARCWYALFFLSWTLGRPEEGLAQLRITFEDDPLSGYVAMCNSLVTGTVGRFAEAVAYAKTAVDYDPSSFVNRWELGVAYHWNGQYEEARGMLDPLWEETHHPWVALLIVPTYVRLGRHDRARAIHDELLARRDRSEYVSPFLLGVCESTLGNQDAAIEHCREGVEGRDALMALFPPWQPDLEPLRSDPRFVALMEQFNSRSGSHRVPRP